MKNRSITLISALLVIATMSSARAEGPNADVKSLFSNVASAYRGFKSLSFSLQTVASGKMAGQSGTLTCKIDIARPKRITAVLTSKRGTIHVTADGTSIFETSSLDPKRYLKAGDSSFDSTIIAVQNAGGCGIGLLTVLLTDPHAETKLIQGTPTYVRRKADAVVCGDKCDIVEAQTGGGKGQVNFRFAFGKTDHLLRQVSVADAAHPIPPLLVESYLDVRLNPSLSDSLFHFTPPKGALAIVPSAPPSKYDTRVRVGGSPIPITGADMDGKQVSLDQYRGKVLLVDFWATWCGPCMAEMPNVVSAYNRYHSQGLEIVGVTLDKSDQTKRIKDVTAAYHMPWRQVYDGKYWSAANATAYSIHAIPFSLLIGRDGKVAAIGAQGTALSQAIEAALNRK